MTLYVIDFETHFDNEYTLKKMTTEAYVRDPRFKVHGMGLKKDNEPAQWVPGPHVERHLRTIDWDDAVVACHHAHFDGLILNHHYGRRPAIWLDTLSMARALLRMDVGNSLKKLSEHFGLPSKGELSTCGKQGLTDSEMEELGRYCCLDVENCYAILFKFKELGFPFDEYAVIDLTIRMFTEPVLELDIERCQQFHDETVRKKLQQLDELGIKRSDVLSADKCRGLFERFGVEVPIKVSAKGNIIPALAKTDDEFLALLEHSDPRVQAVVGARLDCKSTINETRAQRFIDCADRGRMPVYLSYAAAHTWRWGGGDKMNWQNLPRIKKDQHGNIVAGHLRTFVRAPNEHKLVVVDLKQIELRLLNYLAGEQAILEVLNQGGDPYIALASNIFSVPPDQVTKRQRHLGKTAELGLGYGMGTARFFKTAKDGGADITMELADYARRVYRASHPHVVAYWRQGDNVLHCLYYGHDDAWGPVCISGRRLSLPGGTFLDYTAMDRGEDGYVISRGRGPTKLWGGTLVENTVQALARLMFAEAMVKIAEKYNVALTVHDEICLVVPDDDAGTALEISKEIMCTPPAWAPGLPLEVEGYIGQRYDK